MTTETLKHIEQKMQTTLEGLKKELASIRTGRASPSIVEHLKVDYYDTPTPLNQIAGVSVPEARLLVIQPWDKTAIKTIEKAILASDLGLNPSNDGTVIRIAIPPLSEERRQELIKAVKKRIEDRKVAIRNLRREALDELKGLEKSKEISQDEMKRLSEQLQQLTDVHIADIDDIGRDKETELLQV